MKKRSGYVGILLVLSCVLMLAVVGCASSGGKSKEGESCTKTADCADGLKCVGQVCEKEEVNDGGGIDSSYPPDGSYDGGSKDGGSVTDGGGCYPNCPVGDMVEVPAGKFWMGCNSAVDTECKPDESPYHEVNLSAFKIDKYEVTVGQYKACVDAGKCKVGSVGGSCNNRNSGRDLHPINCVELCPVAFTFLCADFWILSFDAGAARDPSRHFLRGKGARYQVVLYLKAGEDDEKNT